MKRRITIVIIITVFVAIFFIAGIPSLRYLKEHSSGSAFKLNLIPGAESGKKVTLDITVEDICLNPMTGEIEIECTSSDACRKTCAKRGCDLSGLKFFNSEFKGGRCFCICLEEDKVLKALPTEN